MSASISKLTPSSLSALLCARICHDLISPVGALGTALEILDDPSNADMHEDAMDLVRNSSRQAQAKLKFLRLALGAGGSAPGIIGGDEIEKLAQDMFADGKATLAFSLLETGVEKNHARILLNLVLLAAQAIPRGGDVRITQTLSGDETELKLVCTGPRAKLAETVVRTLAGKGPEDGFDGRSIQPFYTGLMVREIGGAVQAELVDETTVQFLAKLPNQK